MIIDKNIGFIGLGNVGSKLAYNILKAGYNLFVYDLDIVKCKSLKEKGAINCISIEEIIQKSTVIITCLPSPKSISKVSRRKKWNSRIYK